MGAATTDTRVVVGGLVVLSDFLKVPNSLSDVVLRVPKRICLIVTKPLSDRLIQG